MITHILPQSLSQSQIVNIFYHILQHMMNHELLFICVTTILAYLYQLLSIMQKGIPLLQNITVVSRNKPTCFSVYHSFSDTANIGSHDRETCSHGFDDADGKSLPIAQQEKQIILWQEFLDICPSSQKSYGGFDMQSFCIRYILLK